MKKTKKFFSILSLALLFTSFIACSENSNEETTDNNSTQQNTSNNDSNSDNKGTDEINSGINTDDENKENTDNSNITHNDSDNETSNTNYEEEHTENTPVVKTNDLLSDVKCITKYDAPIIGKIELNSTGDGFEIYVYSKLEEIYEASKFILYRSTKSETNFSSYKKLQAKTITHNSNGTFTNVIIFEDSENVTLSSEKKYFYIVVAAASEDSVKGTFSETGSKVILDDKVKITWTIPSSAKKLTRYICKDNESSETQIKFTSSDRKHVLNYTAGWHSFEAASTKTDPYYTITSGQIFYAGCSYTINIDTSNISKPSLNTSCVKSFSY